MHLEMLRTNYVQLSRLSVWLSSSTSWARMFTFITSYSQPCNGQSIFLKVGLLCQETCAKLVYFLFGSWRLILFLRFITLSRQLFELYGNNPGLVCAILVSIEMRWVAFGTNLRYETSLKVLSVLSSVNWATNTNLQTLLPLRQV